MKHMSIILTEKKKINLRNKWQFVENITDFAVCLKNTVNSLVAQIYKINF
jgi:hypothetical protein